MLFMLVESRHRYRTPMRCNIPLEYLPCAPRLMHKYISLSTVLLSRLEKRQSKEVRAHVWVRNRKGNRPSVSSRVRYGGTRGDVPWVLLPLFFVNPRRGWPFLSLSSDILPWPWRDVRLLSVWNPFGELGREREWERRGGGAAKEDSYPHCRIAIFRPLPLYFTPLIPTP